MNWGDILLAVYIAGVVVTMFCGGFWWNRLDQFVKTMLVSAALLWPAALCGAALALIGYVPFWLGQKARELTR